MLSNTKGRSQSPLLAEDDVTAKKQLTQYSGLAAFLFANTQKESGHTDHSLSCSERSFVLQGLQQFEELLLLFVSKVLNEFSCVLFVHGTSSCKMISGVVGQIRVARDTIEAEKLNLDD